MRRITQWLMATASLLVLLFSYHTSTSSRSVASAKPIAPSTLDPSASGVASSAPSASGGTSGSTSGSASGSTTSGTFTGTAANTQFGPVQVRITVTKGKITSAEAIEYPTESGRDQEINSQAIPMLNQEVISMQGANIDMISGATYTSNGYLQSLQSAIDQAHL